jgi:hypothetical protein
MAAEAYSGEDHGRLRGSQMILVLLCVLTIPAANWLIGHVGTTCVPDGPCLIPVLPLGAVEPGKAGLSTTGGPRLKALRPRR